VHVKAVRVRDEGIYVGGVFTGVGGARRASLARITLDGLLDDSFNPGIIFEGESTIYALDVDRSGNIVIGGSFWFYVDPILGVNGFTGGCLARLKRSGEVDTTFQPGFCGVISALAVQTDGKIAVIETYGTTRV
jgi:Domain of unknown function (DUF5122) beta-propeller